MKNGMCSNCMFQASFLRSAQSVFGYFSEICKFHSFCSFYAFYLCCFDLGRFECFIIWRHRRNAFYLPYNCPACILLFFVTCNCFVIFIIYVCVLLLFLRCFRVRKIAYHFYVMICWPTVVRFVNFCCLLIFLIRKLRD